ncbi:hypothetical protein AAC387_Pa12g1864 [Persea americana]
MFVSWVDRFGVSTFVSSVDRFGVSMAVSCVDGFGVSMLLGCVDRFGVSLGCWYGSDCFVGASTFFSDNGKALVWVQR